MRDALPEIAPAWTATTFDNSVGVDFLGTRAANLAMLRQLTGVYNNAVVSARQHAILAWCAWRFLKAAKAVGRSDVTSKDWRQFLEAVETVQLVAQETAGPELGGVSGGLGSNSRDRLGDDATVPLRFKEYRRTHQTSAMAAVQYGPSARTDGLGFLYVEGGVAVATDRGVRLAKALDELLGEAPGVARLALLPVPKTFPRDLATELGRRGLCIPGPGHPERPEREAYIDALFGFDGQRSDDHRSVTMALLLEWVRRLDHRDGVKPHDVRVQLLGHDLNEEPLHAVLQPTALRWRIFQLRQLHRFAMETWLALVERQMAADVRDVHGMLTAMDAVVAGTAFEDAWGASAADAAGMVLPDAEAWTREYEGGPWWSVWEDIGVGLKDGDDAQAALGALRLTLASLALTSAWVPDGGELHDFAATGGRTRISLLTFARWWSERGRFPLRSVVGELLEELVLQQHVGIAVSRFDGAGRRLRFSLGDRGWELLPGSVPSTPSLTPDRLQASMGLLEDLGLLRAAGSQGREQAMRVTKAGRAVLERVLVG